MVESLSPIEFGRTAAHKKEKVCENYRLQEQLNGDLTVRSYWNGVCAVLARPVVMRRGSEARQRRDGPYAPP
jgi:hypothetical protein